MTTCFILLHVLIDHEDEVYNKLSKIKEVIELHPLYGKYEIIVKIESKDYDSLGEIVLKKIRSIEYILETKTLIEKKVISK